MMTIDSPNSIAGHVHDILSEGYHGVIRYVSPNTKNFPHKRVTSEEIDGIHSVPGMKIGFCYEFEPSTNNYDDQLAYFSEDQAAKDYQRALQVLKDLNVPKEIPVFFGADFDPSLSDINGSVLSYFAEVHNSFSNVERLIGVYGSGETCAVLKEEGVVHYTWLAMSTGWLGYQKWKPQADILQLTTAQVATLSVDTNIVINDEVLW
jgi:Domain of unknown function (DUF1906)